MTGKNKLATEIFTESDLARKARIPEVFNHSAYELVSFHMSNIEGKLEMVPKLALSEAEKAKRVLSPGTVYRAFNYFYKNNSIAHQGAARMEFVAVMQSLQESAEADELRKSRQMNSVIGV
jgi:hypothetical protein